MMVGQGMIFGEKNTLNGSWNKSTGRSLGWEGSNPYKRGGPQEYLAVVLAQVEQTEIIAPDRADQFFGFMYRQVIVML